MFLLSCIMFLTLESWSPSAMPLSCETPAGFCELKNFPTTFHQHKGEQIMTEFSFLGEIFL